jgi:hypothetical protein
MRLFSADSDRGKIIYGELIEMGLDVAVAYFNTPVLFVRMDWEKHDKP